MFRYLTFLLDMVEEVGQVEYSGILYIVKLCSYLYLY